MINLEYNVAGQLISATSVPQYLVADTVGIYRVVFTFDSDWSGLGEKTAVFRNPSVIDVELRDVPVEFPLDENNSALIPGAILDPGKLFIGVYGVNGTQQMPTIWAPPMQVVPGASPGVDAPDDPAIGTAVRTAPQTLTEAEKAQARENIGAIGGVEGDEGNVVVIGSNSNISDSGVSKDNLLIAPQLASNNYKTDSVPYIYRQTGGGIGTGNREYDSIVGGSVVWNQMIDIPTFTSSNIDSRTYIMLVLRLGSSPYTIAIPATDITTTGVFNRIFSSTFTGNAQIIHSGRDRNQYYYNGTKLSLVNGHKYLLSMNFTGIDLSTVGGVTIKDMFCLDLTQMFGSDVADRLLAMEQASAGSGIAVLNAMGLNQYSPYTATPSLESVSGLQSHKTVGFNLWDEDWETGSLVNGLPVSDSSRVRSKNFTPCFPNTAYNKYSHSGLVINIFWYDVNKNFLSYIGASAGQAVTSPQDAYYFKICTTTAYGGTYKHDICVNLSDPARNGTYEPYEEHTYPLDDSLTLRGVAVLDDNSNIAFDGDEYAPDGTVTRRYGIVDLGTLTWSKTNGSSIFLSGAISDILPGTQNGIPHIVCSKFTTDTDGNVWNKTTDNTITVGYTRQNLYVNAQAYISGTTGQFKAAMSGVYLIYERTPTGYTIETAAPYDALQICDPLGTEEYVTTGIVPVGHSTQYPEDQVAKLDGLPSDFSTLIAPTEKAYTATRAYTTGRLLIVNNILYKATTSIASGATLTVGTNIVATTLDEVIASL